MKTSLGLLLVLVIFIPENAAGQIKTYLTDSVAVHKPGVKKRIYHFSDSSELILEYSKKVYLSHNKTEGLTTQVLAANNKTSTEVIWKLKGTIRNITDGSAWNVFIFCEGYIEKPAGMDISYGDARSRIIRWKKGAYGYILDNTDTAGIFILTLDAFEDRLQDDFLSAYARNIPDASRISVKKLTADHDFIINGILKGRKFTIISNGSEFKSWIYMPDGLNCIFFSDFDKLIRKNHERPVPFVIVDKMTTFSERCDLYRLAMLSRLMNEIISIRYKDHL